MKIYIKKDEGESGPFSKEELRDKTYSGEVDRSAMARQEDSSEWKRLDVLLRQAESPGKASPSVNVPLEQLFDPKEKKALFWLHIAAIPVWLFLLALTVVTFGGLLVAMGIVWLFMAFGEAWFAAYLKTNAVRVTEKQLPELYQAVETSCRKLEMASPDVYVIQHNVWNAFAAKIFRRKVIVLFSGAIDSILLKGDMQQLTWVVGHELGHHWAGHFKLSQKLAKMGGFWLIWLDLWHSRRRELTCDRVGLFCSSSLHSSQLAMANMTVGAQLASKMDAEAAASQWLLHRNEFFVRYRTFYSSYPHLLARMDHLNLAGEEFGIRR